MSQPMVQELGMKFWVHERSFDREIAGYFKSAVQLSHLVEEEIGKPKGIF